MLALIAAPLPLAVRSGAAQSLTDPGVIGSAAQKAADQLKGKAKDKVLASAMSGGR